MASNFSIDVAAIDYNYYQEQRSSFNETLFEKEIKSDFATTESDCRIYASYTLGIAQQVRMHERARAHI